MIYLLWLYALWAVIGMAGCTRTTVITVPDGRAVMLAEDVSARVFVHVDDGTPAGKWTKSSNKVTLRAGGYYKALPATRPATSPAHP